MTSPDLAALVTGFFVRYLAAERNVSPHTTAAYRDTLKLLLRFASDGAHRPVTALRFEDFTPDLIRSFLDHLETARHNTVRTRNARLAAIHSFIRYVFDREPGLATICQRILTIPVKKTTRPVLGYFTDTELAHLLAQVDRSGPEGERDYLLLALLYDTGARIQELLDLTPSDCRLASPPYVRIQGKGCHAYCTSFRLRDETTGTHAGRQGYDPAFSAADLLPVVRRGIGVGPCTDAHGAGRVAPMSEPWAA
jgi:site-specific recombinase XerD